jgi:hypothetical protein
MRAAASAPRARAAWLALKPEAPPVDAACDAELEAAELVAEEEVAEEALLEDAAVAEAEALVDRPDDAADASDDCTESADESADDAASDADTAVLPVTVNSPV